MQEVGPFNLRWFHRCASLREIHWSLCVFTAFWLHYSFFISNRSLPSVV